MEPVVPNPGLDGAGVAANDANNGSTGEVNPNREGSLTNKVATYASHPREQRNNLADLHSKLRVVDMDNGSEIATSSENKETATDRGNHGNPTLTDLQKPSPTDPRRIGSETKQSLRLDTTKIEKAEAFLRNPEIRDVSTSEKRSYLESKIGMSPDEIDLAFDRVAFNNNMEPRIRSEHDFRRDLRYSRSNRHYADEFDDGDRNQRLPGLRARRNLDEYYDDRDEYEFGSSPRGRRMNSRRHLIHDTEEYSHPRHMANNGSMNAYNQQGSMNNHGQYPDTTEETPPTSSFFSLPAWAGGFSLGVFCLAALRWLNGGDFVLFPPPTASEPGAVKQPNRGTSDNYDENTDGSSESQQQEEGDNCGGAVETHLNEQLIRDIVADSENEDDYRSEEEGADEAVDNILNGTADSQAFHPTLAHLSYDNLVLEIRSLTSAILSHRDVQERANRTVTAKVGRDVTDDAMDFLRMKKSVSASDKEKTSINETLTQEKVKAISSLLGEITIDLAMLKEKMSKGGETIDLVDNTNDEKIEDSGDRELEDSDGVAGEGDQSSKLFDEIDAKIEQVLAMLQKQGNTEVLGLASNNDQDKRTTNLLQKDEKYIRGKEQPAPSDASDTKPTETDGSVYFSEPRESTDFDVVPNTGTTDQDNENNDVEECLKILSNSNDHHELKVGSQMLYLYCLNISKNPTVPRYRKIYTNNKTFREKVGNLVGAKEFLKAIGFVERPLFFEWSQSTQGYNETKSKLDFALVALELLRQGPEKPNDEAQKTLKNDTKNKTVGTDPAQQKNPSSTVVIEENGKCPLIEE
ncbi:hypothetical protein ACHAXS_011971 [Conticribra weissflogii]